MENSIEKDIHLLESYAGMTHKMTDNQGRPKLDQAIEHILEDYKRVLKENEELKIKNNAIKRESEAYAEHMIRLDNELNLEKEKSKYEWIRQNCLSQELVNKLYIPIQKVKDKIRKNEEIIDISNDGDLIHELLQKNKVYEELLESEE